MSTADIAALAVSRGLLSATGSRTSHAAVVARPLGLVYLVGCADLVVDPTGRRLQIGNHELKEEEPITIDGSNGFITPASYGLPNTGRPSCWIASRSARKTPPPSVRPC